MRPELVVVIPSPTVTWRVGIAHTTWSTAAAATRRMVNLQRGVVWWTRMAAAPVYPQPFSKKPFWWATHWQRRLTAEAYAAI